MKVQDWLMGLRRGWTKFWGWRARLHYGWIKFLDWFRDNFIMLAAAILFLWLLVIWIAFSRGLFNTAILTAYAMYGTAAGTGLLAVATVFMARKNSQLTELTRLSLEKPVIGEIIVYTIEPVEKQIEQDTDAIDAEGVYLYDIPLPHLRQDMIPRSLYDIKPMPLRNIFTRYPHYMKLIQLYPDFENYLIDYGKNVSKARLLIDQALENIQACLKDDRFTKAINAFPSDSKIPLKYLPFWELLSTSGRIVTRPDYDRYHLWSSEVDSFWQNYKEEIMIVIYSTSVPALIVDVNRILKQCEDILVVKAERLNKVKKELKAKYLFTEEELQSIRVHYAKDSGKYRLW